jgi:hypothetical protein
MDNPGKCDLVTGFANHIDGGLLPKQGEFAPFLIWSPADQISPRPEA